MGDFLFKCHCVLGGSVRPGRRSSCPPRLLERLESEYGVPFISVSQPTDSNPAGRMMQRTLANMASFYTEQQSLDVREGLERRIREGWFVGKAP